MRFLLSILFCLASVNSFAFQLEVYDNCNEVAEKYEITEAIQHEHGTFCGLKTEIRFKEGILTVTTQRGNRSIQINSKVTTYLVYMGTSQIVIRPKGLPPISNIRAVKVYSAH